MVQLFEGARKEWKFVLSFITVSLLFLLLQFAYQFYVLIPGELAGSLVRSFALSGATFIGLALLSSIIFKFKPVYAKYWYLRRSLGVMGFTFTLFHVLSVIHFYFQGNVGALFYSLNPIENPIIFGAIAFPLFFIMALTSTDWAVETLGYLRWKHLHQIVYIAYYASVYHFITINPALLENPAGYLLLTVTLFVLLGQLYWFLRIASQHQFKTRATFIGFAIIALYLVTAFFVFVPQEAVSENLPPVSSLTEDSLAVSIEKMTDFMETTGGDPDVGLVPVEEDRDFTASMQRQGVFQNVNYMTSGSVTLEEKDGAFFLVFGENFSTPNGPDLVVYLTKNTAPTSREDIQAGIELSALKSINGKQVYALPAGINPDNFNSVSIHCRAFNVPWSYAPFK